MPEGRPQLYKIRRLVKDFDTERYEYLTSEGKWVTLSMDGLAYTKYGEAVMYCDHLKMHNKDPKVLYHSVVPA